MQTKNKYYQIVGEIKKDISTKLKLINFEGNE